MEIATQLLRHFVAVSSAGGIGAAAKQLGMSQSALSASLQNLERTVGVPLLLRGRQISLTEAGRVLLESAQQIVRNLELLERTVDVVTEGSAGEISVAVPPDAEVWPLPQLIRRLIHVAPRTSITIRRKSSSAHAIEAVASGEVEVALTVGIRLPPELLSVPIAPHRLVLVVPKAWGSLGGLSDLIALGAFPFIATRRGTSAESALRVLKASGADPRIVVRNAPFTSIPPLVTEGVGAAFVHLSMVNLLIRGNMRLVDEYRVAPFSVELIRRPGFISPLTRLLMDVATEVAPEGEGEA